MTIAPVRRPGGDDAGAVRASRRTMAAVIACVATYGVTMGLAWPLLSLILEGRGVSSTLIGLNAAMVSFGTLVCAAVVPSLMARFGPRAFLLGCIVAEIVLFASLRVFDSLPAWFVLRFFIGATGTGLFVVSETWINEIASESHRGRLMGLYNAILSGTIALGPLVLIATGTAGWLPFVAAIGFIALAAVPLVWADQAPPFRSEERPMGLLAFLREAPTLAGAVLLMALIFMASTALLPVYAVRSGLGARDAALLLTVMLAGGVAFQWPLGWMCDHLPRRGVLALCAAGGGLGAAVLPVVIGAPVAWALVFVWGGLHTGLYTVAMTMAGERFRGAKLAQAMASFGILWGLGALLGPGLGGVAMDAWGPDGFPLALAVGCAAFIVLLAARARTALR